MPASEPTEISDDNETAGGGGNTSDIAARSFSAECFFVDPAGVRILFFSTVCKAAKLGLFSNTC